MNKILFPAQYGGTVAAPVSKSHVHRLLICAALSDETTKIDLGTASALSKDIEATVACLSAMGAEIVCDTDQIEIQSAVHKQDQAIILPCYESGSTLRFLLPVVAALGMQASFEMKGRLPQRPLSPLYEEMIAHGAKLSVPGQNPLQLSGKMSGGTFEIAGNISSQYISGLLFALPLTAEGGTIHIMGKRESQAYIEMTLDALRLFGITVKITEDGYEIPGRQRYHAPQMIQAEGDWSNAAFWLALGALSKEPIRCTNLNPDSLQGDRKIVTLLQNFGAQVSWKEKNTCVVCKKDLHAPQEPISAAEIPDLVPILSVVAACCEGTTVICDAGRLRIKESDRLSAVAQMLQKWDVDVREEADALYIVGRDSLKGAQIEGCNDHRMVMSAAIASSVCTASTTITDAQAVEKSYPRFFEDLHSLQQ